MIVCINYADAKFQDSRSFNTKTAYEKGKADKVIEYSLKDIDDLFKEKNKSILSYKRGVGLWLWKPYIIQKTLQLVSEGDFVVYSDAGTYFVNNISWLTDVMQADNNDVMVFELPLLERQFTKKETFVLMDHHNYNLNQILASYLVFRKSAYSVDFVNEWLSFACDERIISFNKFLPDVEEFPDFISHREDQSILSVLCHKKGINPYRDPSQYGDRPWEYANKMYKYRPHVFSNSPYPRIIVSTRNLDPIKFGRKEMIKTICNKLGLFTESFYFKKNRIPVCNKIQ